MMKYLTGLMFLLFICHLSYSQTVYEHISNTNIYDFLDEMANDKFITINDVIKPYSRKMIYNKLFEIYKKFSQNKINLSKRQQEELFFYLKAYILENVDKDLSGANKYSFFLEKKKKSAMMLNPPGLFYKDASFSFALQPVLGAEYSTNLNGSLKHTWGFASLYGYIGKHIGFYTSVRDNDLNKIMVMPDYFVQMQGVPFKRTNDENKSVQFSEARGGISYSWKWGMVGVSKDNPRWGLGYNGTNIQSGKTPSFAMINLHLNPVKWFDFNYFHGWLVSQVIDSASSYWTNGKYRTVYFPKYIAANMFTFYPIRFLNVSFGNSIVYSDVGGGCPHLAYMIPFLFYKSVDHTLNATNADGESGQNSQMYLNISSRNVKHFHLYFSLFVDDFSVSHIKKKDELNYFSYKAGFRLSNLLLNNLSFTAEWTRTNPYVYQHVIATTTYESNKYNMGHYLRDNSREIYFSLGYKPLRGLHFLFSYLIAQHGSDASYVECANNPQCNLHKHPFMDKVMWQNKEIVFFVKYEIVSNSYFYFKFRYSNVSGDKSYVEKYTPEYYWGKTNTFTFGANIGF